MSNEQPKKTVFPIDLEKSIFNSKRKIKELNNKINAFTVNLDESKTQNSLLVQNERDLQIEIKRITSQIDFLKQINTLKQNIEKPKEVDWSSKADDVVEKQNKQQKYLNDENTQLIKKINTIIDTLNKESSDVVIENNALLKECIDHANHLNISSSNDIKEVEHLELDEEEIQNIIDEVDTKIHVQQHPLGDSSHSETNDQHVQSDDISSNASNNSDDIYRHDTFNYDPNGQDQNEFDYDNKQHKYDVVSDNDSPISGTNNYNGDDDQTKFQYGHGFDQHSKSNSTNSDLIGSLFIDTNNRNEESEETEGVSGDEGDYEYEYEYEENGSKETSNGEEYDASEESNNNGGENNFYATTNEEDVIEISDD
ncbi:hypothetical protein QTN25_003434 [Entamoeba marina]